MANASGNAAVLVRERVRRIGEALQERRGFVRLHRHERAQPVRVRLRVGFQPRERLRLRRLAELRVRFG